MDVPMTRESCVECGFEFALPDDFIKARRRDHKTFYCPACETSMHYAKKSDVELAKEEAARCCRKADALERRLSYAQGEAEHLERSRRTTRGHVTRLQKQLVAAAQQ